MWRRAILVALAALAAWAPLPPRAIERFYSHAIYAAIQPPLTSFSNLTPVAILDGLVLVVAVGWLALTLRDISERRRSGSIRAAGRIAGRTLAWSASLYLLFLVAWGLNYRRVPLADKLPFDGKAVTPQAAWSLALASIEQLNRLHDEAHAAGWPAGGSIDPVLVEALGRADREIGGIGLSVAGRPKWSLLNWYFRRAGVDGMTDPYFLETLVSTQLLPFERPFVLAHEWSHLTGLADEGEANFLGWLACVQAPPPYQYSGWLFLYAEIAGSMGNRDRADLAVRLASGPRADLASIRARLVRDVSPAISTAGWRVYDRYLKANRVEAGAASYAQVVRLVLGVRFGAGWHPQSGPALLAQ